jgi:spore coat polysaccharide biosynthesis protein SpsF (cytidylyltransferase family)/predicted dehydrogenase
VKTGFLITARLKSTRLPEKIIRPLHGRPVLAHMLDRLKLAQRIDEIIVCTSTSSQDDRLVELAQAEGVACFRGDEDDVLQRLADATVAHQLDYALNITADCPFVDPLYADRIVEAFTRTDADWIRALDLPHGAYSYGLKPAALRQVIALKDDTRTEVWGRYFTDTGMFKVYDLPIETPLHHQPALRMTLDYPEDLAFFQAVFDHLYQPGKVFSLDDILLLLQAHPEIVALNAHCGAAYRKRWTRQSDIKLKPRYSVKRAVVFGCGSIGQRHIRNLRTLGITDILALRTRKGHHQQLDASLPIRETTDWQEVIDAQPDIAIISNPTSLHLATARRILPYVRGIFIEKPLAATLDGIETLLNEIAEQQIISFVGYQLQFHPIVQKMQEVLAEERLGNPLILQCQVGQWLPNWHPYEDYQTAYYARPELGGGVARTLIHEVHMAIELLGNVRRVVGFLPPSPRLPLDVEVIADIMLQHTSGAVSQLHLDYIQQPTHRSGVLSCERGWLRYDLLAPSMTIQTADDAAPRLLWQAQDYDTNQPYLDEMQTFLCYVREGRVHHAFDAWQATRSLEVVMQALEEQQL